MKDSKIPSHQVDVVEIMKKIRQSSSNSRTEMTLEERGRREARTDFSSLLANAQVPDYLAEQIRQNGAFETYDPRTLYASSRPGMGGLIGFIRKILRPIVKLFINMDPLAHEVHRLTILNNFYLKTMQDLVSKTAAMRVEIHWLNKKLGHQRSRDDSYVRHQRHRNHRGFRHDRREPGAEVRNMNARSAPRNSAEESQS